MKGNIDLKLGKRMAVGILLLLAISFIVSNKYGPLTGFLTFAIPSGITLVAFLVIVIPGIGGK